MIMSQSKSSGSQNKQSGNLSEADEQKRQAGAKDKSSHDHMSTVKAGKDKGAGGGAKQKEGR
jgi:hypothetical protein